MSPEVTAARFLTLTEATSPEQQAPTDKISRPQASSLKLRNLSLSAKQLQDTSRSPSIKRRAQSCSHPSRTVLTSNLYEVRASVQFQPKKVAWSDSRDFTCSDIRGSSSTLESELPDPLTRRRASELPNPSLIGQRASDSFCLESLSSLDDVFAVSPITNKSKLSPRSTIMSGSKNEVPSSLWRASANKVSAVSKYSATSEDQHHLLCSKPPTFPLKPDSLNLRTYTEHQNRILALKAKEQEHLYPISMPLKHAHSWVASSPFPPSKQSNRASSCGPRL